MSLFSLATDTRETGFVNAITAAGVTYAVTRACTMGDLVECSCEKMNPKSKYKTFSSSIIFIYWMDLRAHGNYLRCSCQLHL